MQLNLELKTKIETMSFLFGLFYNNKNYIPDVVKIAKLTNLHK